MALAKLMSLANCSLTALGLAWTELSGFHGAGLLNAISMNKSLETLDVSYNTLGGHTAENPCVTALGKVLKKNRTLTHLDASYNHFTRKNTVELSKSLKTNHVLLGLHYEGNEGWVDSRGFLRCSQTNVKSNKLAMGGLCGVVRLSGADVRTKLPSCWCCTSWDEEVFEFKVERNGGDEDQSPSEGVYLCLSIDTPAFTPTRMSMVEPGIWRVNRMLPPGVCEYMFQFTKGGEVVREHCLEQPTLRGLKNAVSTVGKTNILDQLAKAKGRASVLLSNAGNANGGKGSALVNAFGIGAKKGICKPFMKRQDSNKNLWQKRMAKAKNNLSNRERLALKELAKKNLYGEEIERDEVDFER